MPVKERTKEATMFYKYRIVGSTPVIIWSVLFAALIGKLRGCPTKCSCVSTIVNCNYRQLYKVPDNIPLNTTVLGLNGNYIKQLHNNSFGALKNLTFLDLGFNEINLIEQGSFGQLNNLEFLILIHNAIQPFSFSMTPSSFEGLWNLKYLDYRRNNGQRFAQTVLDVGNLTKLEILDLSGCAHYLAIFPPNYTTLKNLRILKLDVSIFDIFTKDGFKNLHSENIEIFSCNSCALTYIEFGVLQRFTRLQELYLASNYFRAPALSNVTLSLFSPVLSVLDLSELPFINNLSTLMFKALADSTLKTLVLRKLMKKTTLEANTFIYLNNLLTLDLRWSQIKFMEDGAFRGLDNLQKLYFSYTKFVSPWSPPVNFFPPSLQELYLDEIKIKGVYSFLYLSKLVKLSICKSSHYPLNKALFSPENSLKDLNLSYSTLNDMPYEPFAMLTKLNILDISNSNLSLQSHLFHNLKNLITLNLTNCGIFQLEPDLFRDQQNLRILILKDNFITGWLDRLFVPLVNLEELNLAKNSIKIVNESFYRMWKKLKIDLLSNPFNCSCEMLWFRHQISSNVTENTIQFLNKDLYKCASPVEYAGHPFIDVVVDDLEKKCQIFPWNIQIIIGLNSVVVFFVIVMLFFCYRYRWYVRWYFHRFFSFKRSHIRSDENDVHAEEDIKFYCSYAHEDSDWFEEFITKFEIQYMSHTNTVQTVDYTATNEDGNGHENENSDSELLNLLNNRVNVDTDIYYEKRNAVPNKSEIGQMGEAIFKSRNVVIAVSLGYLNNSKHQFELNLMQQAMMERYGSFTNTHMIFVTLEKSHKITSLLPRHLRNHFETTALIWNREDIVEQTRFWEEFNKRFE